MGKDSEFKNNIAVKDFSKNDNFESDFYIPDCVLINGKTMIIAEHSSTGDRKVHIGELVQFLTYVSRAKDDYDEFYLIIYLDGVSDNSPKESAEKERLQYYYDAYSLQKNVRKKIAGIFIRDYKDVKATISNIKLSDIKKYPKIDL